MRYALVEGIKSEANPKARGICRFCRSEVIAHCGKYKIWHWSHKSLAGCDRWWEAETEWHRNWKDNFPKDWQEVILRDVTGERHVADVRTSFEVVIEFQRSTIEPAEVMAREDFYRKMVWVVDGTRNEMDAANFRISLSPVNQDGFAKFHWFSRSKLFHRWHSNKPVFIDFGALGFWRICRFDTVKKTGILLYVDRGSFVDALTNGTSDFSKNGGPAS